MGILEKLAIAQLLYARELPTSHLCPKEAGTTTSVEHLGDQVW